MKIYTIQIALILTSMGFSFPPGSPMSEFGPAQVSLGAFFDHSGQDLYETGYPSLLNSTGMSIDYAPWTFVQMGIFGGGGELDIALPDAKVSDTSLHAYNSDYNLCAGASAKLSTPRFARNTTRGVAFGSVAYLQSSDGLGNSRTPIIYTAGASAQFMVLEKLNFVLGGEFYAWDGDQKSAGGEVGKFGLTEPLGITDHLRGLVGVEYFFKGRNRPFVSLAFRPTGSLGWHDQLGLRNSSISISLGAIATLGKSKIDTGSDEEASSILDQ